VGKTWIAVTAAAMFVAAGATLNVGTAREWTERLSVRSPAAVARPASRGFYSPFALAWVVQPSVRPDGGWRR
jgi:hypothetical protein